MYVHDVFLLSDDVKGFQSCLNYCQGNMPFTIETEPNNKTLFLDINIICE